MFISLSFCLSICLSSCHLLPIIDLTSSLAICLSFSHPAYLSVYPSHCPSCLSAYVSLLLPICQFILLFVFPVCLPLPICLFNSLPVCLSPFFMPIFIHLAVCLSAFCLLGIRILMLQTLINSTPLHKTLWI